MNRDTFATKLGRKGCVSDLVVAVGVGFDCELSLLMKFYSDLFNCNVGKCGEFKLLSECHFFIVGWGVISRRDGWLNSYKRAINDRPYGYKLNSKYKLHLQGQADLALPTSSRHIRSYRIFEINTLINVSQSYLVENRRLTENVIDETAVFMSLLTYLCFASSSKRSFESGKTRHPRARFPRACRMSNHVPMATQAIVCLKSSP